MHWACVVKDLTRHQRGFAFSTDFSPIPYSCGKGGDHSQYAQRYYRSFSHSFIGTGQRRLSAILPQSNFVGKQLSNPDSVLSSGMFDGGRDRALQYPHSEVELQKRRQRGNIAQHLFESRIVVSQSAPGGSHTLHINLEIEVSYRRELEFMLRNTHRRRRIAVKARDSFRDRSPNGNLQLWLQCARRVHKNKTIVLTFARSRPECGD